MTARKLKPRVLWSIVTAVAVCALVAVTWFGVDFYNYAVRSAISQDANLKIYPGTTMEQVSAELYRLGAIQDPERFMKMAKLKGVETAAPGNYDFTKGEALRTILNRINRSYQTPIRLTFNNFRTIEKLAGAIGRRAMYDSLGFLNVFLDDSLLSSYGLTRETALAMYMPNTYEVYWTITPEEFARMMNKEYQKFWTQRRLEQAQKLGLTSVEVSILASIVIEETKAQSEMGDVAGVYLNRLRIGMPLQADPTVKFAVGDPMIKRITAKHLRTESPYNTYKNRGLPPGLIAMPSVAAIDSALSYDGGHKYLYFCAKADFSGRHAFARTLSEHNRNAAAYIRELNRRGIK